MKIMPASPEEDLNKIEEKAKQEILDFGAGYGKTEIEPIAFGLKAVKIFFIMDESRGGTEDLEENLRQIDGVQSAEVTDVRRAIG